MLAASRERRVIKLNWQVSQTWWSEIYYDGVWVRLRLLRDMIIFKYCEKSLVLYCFDRWIHVNIQDCDEVWQFENLCRFFYLISSVSEMRAVRYVRTLWNWTRENVYAVWTIFLHFLLQAYWSLAEKWVLQIIFLYERIIKTFWII